MTLLEECDAIEMENFKREALAALQKVYGDVPIPREVQKLVCRK